MATDAVIVAARAVLIAALLACAGCGTAHAPAVPPGWASAPNGSSDGGGGSGGGSGGM